MATNLFNVDCDTQTCVDVFTPAAVQDQNCPANVRRSELKSIILVHPTLGTPIANWGASMVAADYTIDNTDVTSVSQKQFFGIGSVSESEDTLVTLNDSNQYRLKSTYTMEFSVMDIPAETDNFFRQIECGVLKPLFYYVTVDDQIYGSATGIKPSLFKANKVLDSGEDAVVTWKFTVTWDAKVSPDNYDYPL